MFTRDKLKEALLSILIGATVAFLTTFFEGLLDILNGTENNLLGGSVATVTYAIRRHIL